LGDGADEVPMAECGKVEVFRRLGSPEAKRINRFAAVTGYRPIKWNPDQTRGLANDCLQVSAAHFKRAIQLDFDLLVRPLDLPWILPAEPVVRLLLLPAIPNGLLENAVFIAQSVTHGRELHSRHGVEKASGQAPETTIAEAGVG